MCYIPGGFSNKLVADKPSVDSNIDFNVSKTLAKVTFVHDDDIPGVIVEYSCRDN